MKARRDRWSGLGVLVVLAFVAGGCDKDKEEDDSASCSSLCEDSKKCKDADQGVDCRDSCDQQEALVERAGCKGQYDDVIDCIDHVRDICQVSSGDCVAELNSYNRCMQVYCETHLDECVV